MQLCITKTSCRTTNRRAPETEKTPSNAVTMLLIPPVLSKPGVSQYPLSAEDDCLPVFTVDGFPS